MNRSTLYRLAEDRVSPLFETGRKSWSYWIFEPDGSKKQGFHGSFYEVSFQRKLEMVNHARKLLGLKALLTINKSTDWRTQIPS